MNIFGEVLFKMILYHGSNVAVKKPEIIISNRALDFGAGFYTPSDKKQAKRWAELQAFRRRKGKDLYSLKYSEVRENG